MTAFLQNQWGFRPFHGALPPIPSPSPSCQESAAPYPIPAISLMPAQCHNSAAYASQNKPQCCLQVSIYGQISRARRHMPAEFDSVQSMENRRRSLRRSVQSPCNFSGIAPLLYSSRLFRGYNIALFIALPRCGCSSRFIILPRYHLYSQVTRGMSAWVWMAKKD